jgi:hypothetical protein
MKVFKSKRVITLAIAIVMAVGVLAVGAYAVGPVNPVAEEPVGNYTQNHYWWWDNPDTTSPGVVLAPMGDDAVVDYFYDIYNEVLVINLKPMTYRGVEGWFTSFEWNGNDYIEHYDSTTHTSQVIIPFADLGSLTAPFFLHPVDVQIELESGAHIPLPDLYFEIEYGYNT